MMDSDEAWKRVEGSGSSRIDWAANSNPAELDDYSFAMHDR